MIVGQRPAARPGHDVAHIGGKALDRLIAQRIERMGHAPVTARCAAEAEIDATGRERLDHGELLGHFQRRIVGQHDACRAHANALRLHRNRSDENLRRGAHDGLRAVMLAHPEAVVAQPLAMLRHLDRLADRHVLCETKKRR